MTFGEPDVFQLSVTVLVLDPAAAKLVICKLFEKIKQLYGFSGLLILKAKNNICARSVMWLDWTPRGRVLVSAKGNGMGEVWQMKTSGGVKERGKAALPNNLGGSNGIKETDALRTGLRYLEPGGVGTVGRVDCGPKKTMKGDREI